MPRFFPTWDTTDLYSGPADSKLTQTLHASDDAFSELQEALSAPNAVPLEQMLSQYDRAAALLSTPSVYISMLDMTGVTGYGELQELLRRVTSKQSDTAAKLTQLLAVGSHSVEELTKQDPAYSFFISEKQRVISHVPGPEQQQLLRTMQLNGGSAWYRLWSELNRNAALTVTLPEGEKKLSLSEVRGFATATDSAVRKAGYEAELHYYHTYEVSAAACLNGIKGEALQELPIKRYDSVWDEMLDVNKISHPTLMSMLGRVKAHLPVLRDYLKAKAKLLGHMGGLPWYDILAPICCDTASLSYDEAHDALVDAFRDFSPELSAFIHEAFIKRKIDALPAKGRSSGGICMDLPALREHRVLVNYTGAQRDVRYIAHELGHAYHCRCLDEIPLLLRDAPTPICETASIMNETIYMESCIANAAPAQQLYLLDQQLCEAVQNIMDIYSRYLFEDEVFRRRTAHYLPPEELCEIMEEAQKTVFGDAICSFHPYMWINKVHYYIPEFHYYNYPYIFGYLFSKGLYAAYLRQPEGFPEKYRALLAFTCSGNMEQIASQAGMDITNDSFWESAMQQIDTQVKQFLEIIEKMKE